MAESSTGYFLLGGIKILLLEKIDVEKVIG